VTEYSVRKQINLLEEWSYLVTSLLNNFLSRRLLAKSRKLSFFMSFADDIERIAHPGSDCIWSDSRYNPVSNLLTCYLKISWDLKELILANFVLFYLNEEQNLLRARWHLMDGFQPIEESVKSFGGS
jgi:hypothetical protein